MAEERTCKATRDDGEPCQSPFVGDDGYCEAHHPGNRELLRERARRGGLARSLDRSGPEGLDENELPPLEDPTDVKAWLRLVNTAVATGRLGNSEGNTLIRGLRAHLRAHKEKADEERLLQAMQLDDSSRAPAVTPKTPWSPRPGPRGPQPKVERHSQSLASGSRRLPSSPNTLWPDIQVRKMLLPTLN